jgi:hypothetical protein
VTEFNLDAFRLTAEDLRLIESAQRDKPIIRSPSERVRGLYLRGPVPKADKEHGRPAPQTRAPSATNMGAGRPTSSSVSSSVPLSSSLQRRDGTSRLILSGEHFVRSPPSWRASIYQSPKGWAAIRVAAALWYYAGSQRTRTVRLNLSRLHAFGLGRRKTASEGLSVLERLGLVQVVRHGRRSPLVTIVHPQPQQDSELPVDDNGNTQISG